MENITDDELFHLLDGTVSAEERQVLTNKLSQDTLAQKRLKEFEAVHLFLQNQKGLEQPSKNFTDKVMERLHAKPSLTAFSPRNGLILLAGLVVASGLALILLASGSFDQLHTIFNFGDLPVKNDLVKVPTSIPFDLKVFVKGFVLLNLVIAFILLDRTILRPIFQRRSERLTY
ncbi:hypothetical protein WSM22_45450 [Cytophagales bacterium WSM2-2]|nr:hypothetical protein WSM22_45450 [Cytophagales bacterium WSM2-2]